MWKFTISLGLMFLGLCLFGQVQLQEDTTRVRPPKPPKVKKEAREFIPTGVRVGWDLNSFSRNFWDQDKKLQEYQLDIDFRHFLLNFEYGISEVEEEGEGFRYMGEGNYYRIGLDINFMHHPDKLNVLFAGFRYASSTFDDVLDFTTEDAYGTTGITVSNDNGKAQWAELVTGTKINLWKGLFIGFTIRYKFLKSVTTENLEPFWIPGYGENREDDKDTFGFSYSVFWRFGFRKSAIDLNSQTSDP